MFPPVIPFIGYFPNIFHKTSPAHHNIIRQPQYEIRDYLGSQAVALKAPLHPSIALTISL